MYLFETDANLMQQAAGFVHLVIVIKCLKGFFGCTLCKITARNMKISLKGEGTRLKFVELPTKSTQIQKAGTTIKLVLRYILCRIKNILKSFKLNLVNP